MSDFDVVLPKRDYLVFDLYNGKFKTISATSPLDACIRAYANAFGVTAMLEQGELVHAKNSIAYGHDNHLFAVSLL
jgi:hypothetical protein